jgi:hypothetical protein
LSNSKVESPTAEPRLKVGDWVEVRSKTEILATLDENGCLEGMPFMPEMLSFCGLRLPVYKRAHKTCDTVFPVRGRRVHDAVHLNTRCDGSAHGGCQAGCLIFWKEAWLKPVAGPAKDSGRQLTDLKLGDETADANLAQTTTHSDPASGAVKYRCQATQLPYATAPLQWWEISQYIEDYRSGNVGLGAILRGFFYSAYYHLSKAGIGLGRPLRWLYDKVRVRMDGTLFPRRRGTIPEGAATPTSALNLQPGELVRVKSHQEILQTLNVNSMNRGMTWDAEMVPYCGGTYRVLRRVTQIINESTGEMQVMKNPCIILDSVICQSKYSHCRMFCPRSIYPYWREIWLERVNQN